MSRTMLCAVTALGLAVLSLGLMAARYKVLGAEVQVPRGPDTWKVTLVVRGQGGGDARLLTATPLDFGRQHVSYEACHSDELLDRPPESRPPERRQVQWVSRSGGGPGRFRARYEFYCTVDVQHPTSSMARHRGRATSEATNAPACTVGVRRSCNVLESRPPRICTGLRPPAAVRCRFVVGTRRWRGVRPWSQGVAASGAVICSESRAAAR